MPADGRARPAAHSLDSLTDLAQLRAMVMTGLRDHFQSLGLPEVRVPALVDVTGACENVDTLFAVASAAGRSSKPPHRGFLTQTGQLLLERFLIEADGCWCNTGSYRDDSSDARHLTEFELVEEEFALAIRQEANDAEEHLHELLERVSAAVRAAVAAVDLTFLRSFTSGTEHAEIVTDTPFPRYEYSEALDITNFERTKAASSPLKWGDDLTPSDEMALLAHAAMRTAPIPVFVTHFPAELKFFNMKVDPKDAARVLSADLLLPCAGEAVGAAVREDNYATLRSRLEQSTMLRLLRRDGWADISAFEPYLDLIRHHLTPPHAGYGLGLERLLQFLCAAPDIRQVSMLHRLTTGAPAKQDNEIRWHEVTNR